MNKPIDLYYKISAALGLIVLFLTFLPSGIRNSLSFVSIIIEILGAAALFLAGRSAKVQHIDQSKLGQ